MPLNIAFVSHCDFTGNSAMHLFAIANVLSDLGNSCAVCVPSRPETVRDLGEAPFQELDYRHALGGGMVFTEGDRRT